jgi:hypothetical protein
LKKCKGHTREILLTNNSKNNQVSRLKTKFDIVDKISNNTNLWINWNTQIDKYCDLSIQVFKLHEDLLCVSMSHY